MDSIGFRSSIGNMERADSSRSIDSPRNSQGIRPAEGSSSSRLSSMDDTVQQSDKPRNVKALAYDAGDVRTAVGNKGSKGRFKNWLSNKLLFVGKTTYGKMMQKADAYSANMGNLLAKERNADLKSLLADITKWRNAHGVTSAKGQAIEQLRQSVVAELGQLAQQSRDAAMDKVEDYFDVLCGRAPDPKSGQTGPQQPLSSKLIFRQNSDASKALTEHLKEHAPAGYTADLTRLAHHLTRHFDPGTCHVEIESDKGRPATLQRQLQDGQFQALLEMAEPMMTALMGGKDGDSIQAAVDALPDEIVDTLAELDRRVDADSGRDAATRRLAIVGTLFLRFASPAITDGVDMGAGKPSKQDVAKRLLMATVQSTLNNSPDPKQVTSAVHDRHKADYLEFVRGYQQPMLDFVDAVLERAGRPPL